MLVKLSRLAVSFVWYQKMHNSPESLTSTDERWRVRSRGWALPPSSCSVSLSLPGGVLLLAEIGDCTSLYTVVHPCIRSRLHCILGGCCNGGRSGDGGDKIKHKWSKCKRNNRAYVHKHTRTYRIKQVNMKKKRIQTCKTWSKANWNSFIWWWKECRWRMQFKHIWFGVCRNGGEIGDEGKGRWW